MLLQWSDQPNPGAVRVIYLNSELLGALFIEYVFGGKNRRMRSRPFHGGARSGGVAGGGSYPTLGFGRLPNPPSYIAVFRE